MIANSMTCLLILLNVVFDFSSAGAFLSADQQINTEHWPKSIEEMALDYEDDKNSMIALTEKGIHIEKYDHIMFTLKYEQMSSTYYKHLLFSDDEDTYNDFYSELDNRMIIEQSMNMIFFGPAGSFMRLDPESILHIFLYSKQHLIPIARTLLAWDMITDGKTSAFLQSREYLAFNILLNVVPEEDLYYVNLGDPTVLKYFANTRIDLDRRKFGVLAASYRRYFGGRWYFNSTNINRLGYLLCGFPRCDLELIPPKIFREINIDVFSKIERCTSDQLQALYQIATHPEAYGQPYKWTSYEITRLDVLFTCIARDNIDSIQLEAISAISYTVMKAMPQIKLGYFTKQQILRMNPETRRIFILRNELRYSLDMNQITKYSSRNIAYSQTAIIIASSVLVISL